MNQSSDILTTINHFFHEFITVSDKWFNDPDDSRVLVLLRQMWMKQDNQDILLKRLSSLLTISPPPDTSTDLIEINERSSDIKSIPPPPSLLLQPSSHISPQIATSSTDHPIDIREDISEDALENNEIRDEIHHDVRDASKDIDDSSPIKLVKKRPLSPKTELESVPSASSCKKTKIVISFDSDDE
jgi:hypothetical protein